MNMKYLKYLLKSEKNTNIVLFIIALMIYPFVVLTTNIEFSYYDPEQLFYMYNSLSTAFMTYLYILTFVMVIVNFKYMHFKRSVDTYMQLALSKKEVFFTKLVYTIIQVLTTAVITFLMGNIILSLRGLEFYGYYVLYACIVMMVGLTLLIFINTYIYQLCNNMIDGIIVMVMYHGLFFLLDLLLNERVFSFNQVYSNSFFSVDMTYFTTLFSNFTYQSGLEFDGFSLIEIRALILFVVLGIVALILSIKDISNRSSERAEQISKNHFCYPVIIISYASILYVLMQDIYYYEVSSMLFAAFLIFIPYIIGMFIYNRKVVLKRKYFITYIIIIVVSASFSYLLDVTGSFGLKNMLPSNYNRAQASIHYYSDDMHNNYKTYFDDFDINMEIDMNYSGLSSDPSTKETYVYYDGRLTVVSTEHIAIFEDLLLEGYEEEAGSAYRDYSYGYVYMTISYYDDSGNEYDRRYVELNMDKEDLIAFINSLE